MSKLGSDGHKDYMKANLSELQRTYEHRVAEIKSRYANLQNANVVTGHPQRLVMRWEIVRAKREVFGEDNFYLSERPQQIVAD